MSLLKKIIATKPTLLSLMTSEVVVTTVSLSNGLPFTRRWAWLQLSVFSVWQILPPDWISQHHHLIKVCCTIKLKQIVLKLEDVIMKNAWFYYKAHLYMYSVFQCNGKTALVLPYLYSENSYTGKTPPPCSYTERLCSPNAFISIFWTTFHLHLKSILTWNSFIMRYFFKKYC